MPPPRGISRCSGKRPRASHHPSPPRTSGGYPPRDKPSGPGNQPEHTATREVAGSARPEPTLTQRMVLLEHPLHGAAAGARARPGGVTVPVTTTPRLGGRNFRFIGSLATTRTRRFRRACGRGCGSRACQHLPNARPCVRSALPRLFQAASWMPPPPSHYQSRARSHLTAAVSRGMQRSALIGWRARSPLPRLAC